jgi:hypothetical protein
MNEDPPTLDYAPVDRESARKFRQFIGRAFMTLLAIALIAFVLMAIVLAVLTPFGGS